MQTETLHSLPEAAQRLGIKDTLIKKLVREGRLQTVKIGDRRLVPSRAIQAYIDQLIAEAS